MMFRRVRRWRKQQSLESRLRRARRRFGRVGPENPSELMRAISVSNVGLSRKIGPVSVASLKSNGYHSAADLWNEQTQRVRRIRVYNVSTVRGSIVEYWAEHVRAECVRQANANRALKTSLQGAIIEYETLLAALAQDAQRDSGRTSPSQSFEPIEAGRMFGRPPKRSNDVAVPVSRPAGDQNQRPIPKLGVRPDGSQQGGGDDGSGRY